jgi:hypothetical protein
MINEEHFPWCRKCQDLDDESLCPAAEIDGALGNDGSNALDSLYYVNDEDFICNVQGKCFPMTSDQMKQIKGKYIEANKLTRMYGPMPSQKEIRKIVRKRSLNTSQRRNHIGVQKPWIGKQVFQKLPSDSWPVQSNKATKGSSL